MPNLIGQSLGRYHIVEQLGEGGMAFVYKALDTRLERNVAIKVILPGKEHSDKFLKRFEREAKALASLSHPNIVKVIDYGEHEGLPFLVMEYIPGGTLKHKLGKPIPWPEAVRTLMPIARALAHAHENRIIHRDVKPSNILITQSGEPMLSDFGIAKMLETEETLDLTGTGVGVGTPEYMSPEQAQGKSVDARSDVYSLGVVLYEMITGRKPYQADTPMAVVWKQASEPLPRPKEFVREIPSQVENVLLKALAKSSENRFQDMKALTTMLEKLASGAKLPSESVPREMPPRRKDARPNKRLIPSILTILLITMAGILAGIYMNRDGSKPQPLLPGVSSAQTATPTLSSRDFSTQRALTAMGTIEAYHGTATEFAREGQIRQLTATAVANTAFEAWLAVPPLVVVTPSNLTNATILYENDFDSRPSSREWSLGGSPSVVNGVFRQGGADWQGSSRPAVLNDQDGVLLQFRCAPGSSAQIYLQTGNWNTLGMRRWGINCDSADNSINPNVVKDNSQWVPREFVGNLTVKPGDWYALLLVVGGSNDFIARIWEPASPLRFKEMRSAFGDSWANLQWYLALEVEKGQIDIAEYKEIRLP